jgi:hypothetical protein
MQITFPLRVLLFPILLPLWIAEQAVKTVSPAYVLLLFHTAIVLEATGV